MTSISLPHSVPFPVTVSAVFYATGDSVKRHSTVLKYKYWDYQDDPNSKEDPPRKIRVEQIGSFESPIEGIVESVRVKLDDEIAHSGVVLYTIEEACTHTVQYGGLCALCGAAVEDEKDYTGYNYEDRATIAMSHDNTGLRISLDEAEKIEKSATQKLAEDKKLILVVDLDQTVIHATVDPTVGEWQRDPSNPNYPYVKSVRSFALEEDQILPPGWTGPKPPPTKCWYYVKLRPGLEEFLARVSQLYELHIYTMATRNYALAIANIIDPDGKYFGDRILSRDESGSLTHKNLKRLFPVDQSMVAIIDDRGDVWQWDPNLIKVVPYDFFVGIGDINSSFLPKKNGQLLGPTKKRKAIAQLEELEDAEKESSDSQEEVSARTEESESEESGSDDEPNDGSPDTSEQTSPEEAPGAEKAEQDEKSASPDADESDKGSPVDRLLSLGGGEDNKNLLMEQSMTRSQLVEQQQHDRPLAKLQHNLDKIIHSHDTPTPESDGKEEDEENLLRDDDGELYTLETALENIHKEYFKQYESFNKKEISIRPDLTNIIPQLKRNCLSGVVVLFSGILPLGMNIDNADIVIWCRQFGIKVVNEVYPEVTHVVCRDPSTSAMKLGLTLKVRVAKKTIPGVKVVSPDWIFSCLSSWSKVDEQEYLIDVSDHDWYVSSVDVDKYQKALEVQKQRMQSRSAQPGIRGREDSLSSIEEYDFNDASAEVDDFLAGLSDDEDADGIDDDDDEDDDNDKSTVSNGSSFLRDLYKEPKRKREEEEDEEADMLGESDIDSSHSRKKAKTEDSPGAQADEEDVVEYDADDDDMDELEKELMDELDHLDE